VTSWNRRLSAAQRFDSRLPAARADLLSEAEELGIDPDDQAAIVAMATIAKERPGFMKILQVESTGAGPARIYEFEIAHVDGNARVMMLDEITNRLPRLVSDNAADPDAGPDVVAILTDTLVETPDLVAVFASVGHEALWANDAFVTLIPIREADKIWLVELLDEWSKGHYEVKVLPALVKYGRWRGRLTFLAGADGAYPVSAVIVAHRDKRGEIEAVSLVARDITDGIETDTTGHPDQRFSALVENSTDIIAVVTPEGLVNYASPTATRLFGNDDTGLFGVNLLELVHEDERPESFLALVNPDELGIGQVVELRFLATDGKWRHFEAVFTDLTENPAIGGVVLNARDVTERVEAVSALAARAYTDALTQLPNRMRILDRLATDLAGDGSLPAVLLLDFDRFTEINEAFGRPSGDYVMQRVAERLVEVVGDRGSVGRLGSDEFVVILTGGVSPAQGFLVAGELRATVGEAVELDGGSVELTVSIGLALGTAGQEADDLLLDAGRAMAHAKASGRDRVEVFNDALAEMATRRRTVEQQLRRALDNDGVRVHYQAIVEIETEQIVGAEALMRVHDHEGGLLSPAEFIEAAESSGLIARLGSQVLQLTCEQLASWSEAGSGVSVSDISVNVSPRQLADPDLPNKVVAALEGAGVSADRLCLEITESILIGAQHAVDQSIEFLRTLGVRIGLDDFGAGASSLGYLKRFPLDFVKIDRSLIQGLGSNEHDTAIVRATIELAHNLGLVVVAVGVEFEEQLEMLQILGCDRAQGYLFSAPVPPESFASQAGARGAAR